MNEKIEKRVALLNRRLAALGCPYKVYYDGYTRDLLSELKGQQPAYVLFVANRKTDCGEGLRFSAMEDVDNAITAMFYASQRKKKGGK